MRKPVPYITAATLALAAQTGLTAMAHAQSDPRLLALPNAAAYPEGVASDPATGQLYTNAAYTGAITRLNPDGTGATVISDPLARLTEGTESPSTVALGLKVDGEGRLWIAGARSGGMHVVDASSGALLARYATPVGSALINDVALTADAAYFTDTVRPVLWRIPLKPLADGKLEPWLSLSDSPIIYGDDANLNGITATKDGRYLIVVHMDEGTLFRIDTRSREITRIDTGDSALKGGDGLYLHNQTLFVVLQWSGEVVALALSDDASRAVEKKRIRPDELAWPATATVSGDRLIVSNSQLNRRATSDPALPHSLVSIPLSAFD